MPIPSLLGPLQDALAGRYAIDREIGRGGMATVYLARDVRHERQVALKVLNPDLGAVLGAERFLSEIRVTANLQHPNLLPLFDSGEANGLLFYVMPFVEGESLRQRLERERQLPVDEAVRIAVAIAGALDYAHRRGVIHRDLKPENVLLHEGQPLVADFGIALAVSNAGGTRVTQTGLSLGTPQYMSPEQATSDRAIDGRTDIYSLGAVTYEMLAGEAPHAGATAQAIIARLMTEEPRALSTVRRTVPPHVEAAVHRALEKLPADRFATAEEFAAALSGGTSTVHTTRRLPSTAGKVRRWQIATAAASLVALAAVGFALSSGDEPEPRMRARFVLELPDSARMSRVPGSVTMSHDGKTIAFLTRGPGVVGVWTRRLDELALHRVPGTEGAVQPRFSPDGRAIAFTVGSTLRKVPVEGGSPTQIADSVASSFFAWLDDGTIVFTRAGPDGREALWRVSDAGGTAVQLTTPAAGELEHDSPARLPGGKAAVFAIDDGSAGPASSELAVVRIADGAITRLGIKGTTALYADGFLFFVRPDGTYGAVPFDVQRTRVTGEEISVDGRGSGIIGENGTRVYYPNADAMELMSFDRKGIAERLIAETRPYWHRAFPRTVVGSWCRSARHPRSGRSG